MYNVWYFVLLIVFGIFNFKINFITLRPDIIYLSYFVIGLLVGLFFFQIKVLSSRKLTSFTEELTYFVKMSLFFYLLTLDSLKINLRSLRQFVFSYKQFLILIFNKFSLLFSEIKTTSLKQKFLYLYVFTEKSVLFEILVKRFVYKLFVRNTIRLTKYLLSTKKLRLR
jgi:hypothetical protein